MVRVVGSRLDFVTRTLRLLWNRRQVGHEAQELADLLGWRGWALRL